MNRQRRFAYELVEPLLAAPGRSIELRRDFDRAERMDHIHRSGQRVPFGFGRPGGSSAESPRLVRPL